MKLSLLTASVLILGAASVNAQSDNSIAKAQSSKPCKRCLVTAEVKENARFNIEETIRDANGRLILITKNEMGRDTVIRQPDFNLRNPEFFYGCGIG